MTYEEKNLKVSNIFLDENNPRFPPVNNQRDAIQAMLDEQEDKIGVLAEDIYQNGLNPSSRLIIFREKNRLVDGDGNRRLTALKILETPEIADSHPRLKKKLKQILAQKGEIPLEISCVVFKQRKDARRWIENNHDGEQEGRGQIRWTPEQKDRFRGKPSIGLAALDFLSSSKDISDNDRSQINKTTLDRLLSYKDTKSALSIIADDNGFQFGDKEKLKRVVLGLRNQKVDTVYTAAKGKIYVSNAIANSPKSELNENSNATNQNSESSVTNKASTRSRRQKAESLAPFGGGLTLQPGPVNNLYRDLECLFYHFAKNRDSFTESFVVIFRMALRVLAETASKERKKDLQAYLLESFDSAKKNLDQNTKTTLSNQGVDKGKIVQLFQTGGHDYHNSKNEEQALAMSIILGQMLTNSHGKKS